MLKKNLKSNLSPFSMLQFSFSKQVLAFVALVLTTFVGLSQRPHPPGGRPQGPDRERLDALRVAFMTERLELSPEEAERFWPEFRSHTETVEEIRESLESIHEDLSGTDSRSESWLEEQLDKIFELRAAELEAERALIEGVAEVIGLERAMKIPALEGQFRHRVMEELQKRRSGQGPPARPGSPQRP